MNSRKANRHVKPIALFIPFQLSLIFQENVKRRMSNQYNIKKKTLNQQEKDIII